MAGGSKMGNDPAKDIFSLLLENDDNAGHRIERQYSIATDGPQKPVTARRRFWFGHIRRW